MNFGGMGLASSFSGGLCCGVTCVRAVSEVFSGVCVDRHGQLVDSPGIWCGRLYIFQ